MINMLGFGSPWILLILVVPSIVVLTHTIGGHESRVAHGFAAVGRVRVPCDRIATEALLIVALVDVVGQKLVPLLVYLLIGLADCDRADADLVGNFVQKLVNRVFFVLF